MIIKNGLAFTENAQFISADIEISDGIIKKIAPANTLSGDDVIDAKGCYVTPGFVDIHIHGAKGADFCDNDAAGLETISRYLGGEGVTSFCGTTMAFSEEILDDVVKTALPYFDKDGTGSVLRGINMEGPFFNKAKKGAQAEEYIVNPDYDMFKRLYELSNKKIKLVDIAPELPGSIEFIEKASEDCVVSVAHTCATYDESAAAFSAGATHVTHLFNAMPAFSHREPGVIGAASDDALDVEMICDGIHLHPAVIRAMFRMFGKDRICLVSDSMRACGMPDGEYSLGGQKVVMKACKATLEDGTIAGSATCLADCFRKAVSFGVPITEALCAATINPARCIGILRDTGSITEGKRADVLILDSKLDLVKVFIGGTEFKI